LLPSTARILINRKAFLGLPKYWRGTGGRLAEEGEGSKILGSYRSRDS
jgi:hypothetical protein